MHDLAIIGGSTMKENVQRVMSHVLDHAVALQYNWAGKSGWKSHTDDIKRAFSSLLLSSVITRMYHYNFFYLHTAHNNWEKKINNC